MRCNIYDIVGFSKAKRSINIFSIATLRTFKCVYSGIVVGWKKWLENQVLNRITRFSTLISAETRMNGYHSMPMQLWRCIADYYTRSNYYSIVDVAYAHYARVICVTVNFQIKMSGTRRSIAGIWLQACNFIRINCVLVVLMAVLYHNAKHKANQSSVHTIKLVL